MSWTQNMGKQHRVRVCNVQSEGSGMFLFIPGISPVGSSTSSQVIEGRWEMSGER